MTQEINIDINIPLPDTLPKELAKEITNIIKERLDTALNTPFKSKDPRVEDLVIIGIGEVQIALVEY